jgi:hypothetical protein
MATDAVLHDITNRKFSREPSIEMSGYPNYKSMIFSPFGAGITLYWLLTSTVAKHERELLIGPRVDALVRC